MKYIIFIAGLITCARIFGQGPCSNLKIESAVVSKATDAIASATCTGFTLQWQESPGSTNQDYIARIMFRNSLNPAQIDTVSSPVLVGTFTATFPVTAGMVINWSIEGIKTIDSRTFYSYPLRSNEEYTIPDCVSPAVAAESTTLMSNKLPGTEAEKIKVDLYPNPVHTVLNLNVSNMVKTDVAKNGLIRVVGIDGKTVLTQKAAFGSVQVNVSRLIIGTYFIRVEDAGGKLLYIAKFVKE